MSLLIALSLLGALVQSTAAPPRAAFSGRVLEDGSHAPVAGAQLILVPSEPGPRMQPFPDRPRTAITDADGRYRFDDVEAGRYRLSVQKAGFAQSNPFETPVVDLKPGERRDGVDVMLQKGGVILGRVLDEAGEPVVDGRVMAMQRPPVHPRMTGSRPDVLIPAAGSGAQTNDLGEFRLFGLPPGEYFVQAMPPHEFGGVPAPRAMTMLTTYFPGTSDPGAAQPVSVGAGQTSGEVVIRMIAAPAFQVSGVVRDEAGGPVANVMVRLVIDDPTGRPPFTMQPWKDTRTDTSGKFTINGVVNGTYTLLAVAPVVISAPADARRGVAARGAGGIAFGGSWGSVGGGVTTEMNNGTTIQYRDGAGTRVSITVDQANVSDLEVTVKRSGR